jgi:bZIP transcription factor
MMSRTTKEQKLKLPVDIIRSSENHGGGPSKKKMKPTIVGATPLPPPFLPVPNMTPEEEHREQQQQQQQQRPMVSITTTTTTYDVPTKKRLNRLEQNRRAAKVSRERKKGMVDELQRRVAIFHTANDSLKQQNEELVRLLGLAQNLIMVGGDVKQTTTNNNIVTPKKGTKSTITLTQTPVTVENPLAVPSSSTTTDRSVLNTVVTVIKSEQRDGTTGSAMTSDPVMTPSNTVVPTIIPTNPHHGHNNNAMIQAMSHFQQAATNAMHTAMQTLHPLPQNNNDTTEHHHPNIHYELPPIPPDQQAYMDNMAAIAIQNSLTNHPDHLHHPNHNTDMLGSLPFNLGPFFTWQQSQQQQQQQQQTQPQ